MNRVKLTLTLFALAPFLAFSLATHREAWVALFYGNDEGFLLGMRVLGQSIREAGSTREMVALCLPDVSDNVKVALVQDGWIIHNVDPTSINYQGPYAGHVAKLSVLTLTQFSKVVLLDTDVTAYPGIDDIFNCGSYCAVMRHSNMFNSGVMVLTPSNIHFKNILQILRHWDPMQHSHKGGDQDILNYYFKQITFAPTYNKSAKVANVPEFAQLPFEYNLDAGMYYLRDEWLISALDFRFLHYTLGPVRPWQWFTYPIFELNWHWQDIRYRMEHPTQELLTSYLRYLPFYVLLLVSVVRLATVNSCHRYVTNLSNSTLRQIITSFFPSFYRAYKVIFFSCTFLCVLLAIATVPMHVRVWLGWVMFTVSFVCLEAHLLEFYYILFHYGSPTSETIAKPNRLLYVHLKLAFIAIIAIIFTLLALVHTPTFSTRVKLLGLIACALFACACHTLDYLVQLYSIIPSSAVSPSNSPIRNKKHCDV